MSYYQMREIRLGFAAGTNDWGMPKLPYGMRNIGRVVIAGPNAGFYPIGHHNLRALNAEAVAREKRQNRETNWNAEP